MEQFFSVTRGRSATSTFCTYCGGCSVPRHIYIYLLLNLKDSYFEPAVGPHQNFSRMCGYRPY